MLFELWTQRTYRATRDADFLARGHNAPERFIGTFTAYLERARIPIQIDLGFGDAVTPAPVETQYPTLLPAPGPRLLTYPKETVVAEKFEAMVKLGIANSRMKDFYDLEALSRILDFDGKTLREAIGNTFERRGSDLPAGGTPVAFSLEFYNDTDKKKQWTAFCTKNATYVTKIELKEVIENIKRSWRRSPRLCSTAVRSPNDGNRVDLGTKVFTFRNGRPPAHQAGALTVLRTFENNPVNSIQRSCFARKQAKSHKCRIWCRLRGLTRCNQPLELDRSWSEVYG